MLGLHRARQWISLPGALAGTIFILPLVLGLVVLQTRTTWIGLLFTASSAGRFRGALGPLDARGLPVLPDEGAATAWGEVYS